MARKQVETEQLSPGERVIAVAPIGRVPEGTHGVVKLTDGLTWIRYWVSWENGIWMGSIDGSKLVREGRYEQYKEAQAEAEARAASGAATPVAPTADGAEAGPTTESSVPASRVPEHLLERSRQARARKGA